MPRLRSLLDGDRRSDAYCEVVAGDCCHDLEFVFDYCDTVTVMRIGRTVARRTIRNTDRDEVIGLVTGARIGDPA
jgi:ABC-type hemin transport system ATPase subunit